VERLKAECLQIEDAGFAQFIAPSYLKNVAEQTRTTSFMGALGAIELYKRWIELLPHPLRLIAAGDLPILNDEPAIRRP
jgi:hypothetical protein